MIPRWTCTLLFFVVASVAAAAATESEGGVGNTLAKDRHESLPGAVSAPGPSLSRGVDEAISTYDEDERTELEVGSIRVIDPSIRSGNPHLRGDLQSVGSPISPDSESAQGGTDSDSIINPADMMYQSVGDYDDGLWGGSSNSSSCSTRNDCSECVGAFSTSTSCVWCSSSKECLSKSTADSYCLPDDQTGKCEASYYTIIFIIILGLLICICVISCFLREWNRQRREATAGLRRPLLTRTRYEVLKDVEAEEDWMCVICGFDNLKGSTACTMCGTSQNFCSDYAVEKLKERERRRARRRRHHIAIPEEAQIHSPTAASGAGMKKSGSGGSIDVALIIGAAQANAPQSPTNESSGHSIAALTSARSTLTNIERQEAFNYRRLNQLSIRQKSARRRKMWQRVVDEETGNIVWARGPPTTNKEILNTSQSIYSPNQSFSENGRGSAAVNALLSAFSPERKPAQPRDSFDATLVSTSPGYVSHFSETGTLQWERVESGREASTSVALHPHHPHYSGSIQNHLALQISTTDLASVAALSFVEKQLWFLDRMSMLQRPWSEGHIRIEVDRDKVFEQSAAKLMFLRRSELHQWMRICFRGEEGLDAGGLEREWFGLVAKKLFSPELGLFTCSSGEAANAGNYNINPLSGLCCSDHTYMFQFAGRFLAKAIMEQQTLPAYLSLPLRKQILSLPITFSDLEFIDVEVYQNLVWLLDNNSVEQLGLYFTIDYQAPSKQMVTYELKPGGSNILVTDENKEEYLQLRLKHRMLDSIKPQLERFLTGFYEVLPPELLCVFDYQELELLMCGIPDINVSDWKKNTEYIGLYNRPGKPLHRVVKWFWEAVEGMSAEERVRLLQFVTGSGRLPVHGFQALQSNDGNFRKFNIQSISKEDSVCPRSHTCFNKLDLPVYDTKEELDAYLSVVVNMEVTGFSME